MEDESMILVQRGEPIPMLRLAKQLAYVLAALILVALTPLALLAQARVPLEPGTRVRIEARALTDTLLIGKVVSYRSDTLTFAPSGELTAWTVIPVSEINVLEVSRGRPTFAVEGAVAGAVAGALTGLMARGSKCWPMCEAIPPAGAVLGSLLGALVGFMIPTGEERWRVAQ